MSEEEDFTHCPFCGMSRYTDHTGKYPDDCASCYKRVPTPQNIGGVIKDGELRDISGAIYAQSESATRMLAALVSAQALPLVSLLEKWWTTLIEKDRETFVKALLARVIRLVGLGDFDSQVLTFFQNQINWFDPELFKNQLRTFNGSNKFAEVIVERLGEKLLSDDEYKLTETMKVTVIEYVTEITNRHMADHKEVIEAAVRDRMPDIEKLTERVVREVADDAAKDIRDRMRRSDDKSGGAYR